MTGIVILAAGASTRMGQPKQQLKLGNRTLLQMSIDAAVNSEAEAVVIVLGAKAAEIEMQITASEQVTVCKNDDWPSGMASSIRSGLLELLDIHPDIGNALFMLCDQPFTETALLNRLIEKQQEKKAGIVACTYQETTGAPVLFNRSYFNELLTLTGQEGAKKLLTEFSEEVVTVPFDKGGVDIDTPEDYQRLLERK